MIDLQSQRSHRVAMADEAGQGEGVNASHWEFARSLEVAGTKPADIQKQLQGRGLDVESARVLVNSLPSAKGPSVLPEARLDMTNNPLTAGGLSSADIGMKGPRKIVGLYWATFGAALGIIIGAILFADEMKWLDQPIAYGVKLVMRYSIGAAVLAIVFGVFKMFTRED